VPLSEKILFKRKRQRTIAPKNSSPCKDKVKTLREFRDFSLYRFDRALECVGRTDRRTFRR